MAGGFWGVCDPAEPKNRRTRASVIIENEDTRLLIDASFDLRDQLNRFDVKNLDAALLTHDHADHTNGLDDLKGIVLNRQARLDVYSNAACLDEVDRRCPYLFQSDDHEIYRGFLNKKVIAPYQRLSIGSLDIQTFDQDHKTCTSVGYRFGDFAYSVDMVRLEDRAVETLKGVKVWIVDAGSYWRDPPGVHANIQSIIKWAETIRPEIVYLTVLAPYMDYQTLCNELPPHIRPAHDGLIIDL